MALAYVAIPCQACRSHVKSLVNGKAEKKAFSDSQAESSQLHKPTSCCHVERILSRALRLLLYLVYLASGYYCCALATGMVEPKFISKFSQAMKFDTG